jgi:hypothetical protein
MPPAPRIHPSSAPSTPYRPRTFSAVVDASAFSSPATSEHGRRRAVSSSTSPYPQTRQAIAVARAATRNEQRVRRVLAEIDWWTVMSGQQPDDEDDEQEEEGEQQGLFLANAQHVVFDDDELENESAGEHPMLTPSSLAPSSEDGSQFADDGCEDTATAHDEVGMASLHLRSCHSPSSSSKIAHITLLIPIHSVQMQVYRKRRRSWALQSSSRR